MLWFKHYEQIWMKFLIDIVCDLEQHIDYYLSGYYAKEVAGESY